MPPEVTMRVKSDSKSSIAKMHSNKNHSGIPINTYSTASTITIISQNARKGLEKDGCSHIAIENGIYISLSSYMEVSLFKFTLIFI